ncbi:WD repeat-containing protein 74 [Rhizophlyctis rosea]|nr:WD repeat-containing protein 74 [Rhizophlyctis rosea]
MKYLTGDEVGIVKCISFKRPLAEEGAPEPPRKRQRQTEEDTKDKKDKQSSEPQAHILSWGAVDRAAEVERMCWAATGEGEEKQLVVARKGGWVHYFSTENGAILRTERCFVPAREGDSDRPKLNKHRKEEHFVGIHDVNNTLIMCTDLGTVRYINPSDSTEKTLPDVHASIGLDLLFSMKVHPTKPHIFATGGDERELCIWDVTKLSKEAKDGEELPMVECIWKAKNVKNDELNLRVPVWITHLEWIGDGNTSKIVVGTGYHQIRVYDIEGRARRPIINVEIGEHPVRALAVAPDASQAIFSDTIGTMTAVDLKTGKTNGTYKGLAGAVTSIHVYTKRQQVVTVGMDRFMRIYELGGARKVVKKVYLKQRLTTLLVDEEGGEEDVDVGEDGVEKEEEEEDEELWAQMREVGEKGKDGEQGGRKKKEKRKLDDADD